MRFLSLICGIFAIILSFACFADRSYDFWVLIIACVGVVAATTDFITARRNPRNYLIASLGIILNVAALLIWLVCLLFFAVETSVDSDHASLYTEAIFIDGE